MGRKKGKNLDQNQIYFTLYIRANDLTSDGEKLITVSYSQKKIYIAI